MTRDQGERVAHLLESRNDLITEVRLRTGQSFVVHNVVSGRDIDADFDHFTTNISPEPIDTHTVDFFHADQVARVVASESGEVLLDVEMGAPQAKSALWVGVSALGGIVLAGIAAILALEGTFEHSGYRWLLFLLSLVAGFGAATVLIECSRLSRQPGAIRKSALAPVGTVVAGLCLFGLGVNSERTGTWIPGLLMALGLVATAIALTQLVQHARRRLKRTAS